MHYLYILYSEKLNKYYIGETINVENRLIQHNNHKFKKAFTKSSNDWIIKLTFICESKKDAIFLEKFIKRMKSRVFVEKIITNSNILDDILLKNN